MLEARLREPHTVLAYGLFGIVLAQIAVALLLALIRRDGMVVSMSPWRSPPAKTRPVRPGSLGSTGNRIGAMFEILKMRAIPYLSAVAACAVVATARAGEAPLGAVVPYTAETNPRVALKWGAEALPRINQLRLSAAERAARSGECDSVTAAELFDLRSESADHWTIRVECHNGRTFFLRQADLKRRS